MTRIALTADLHVDAYGQRVDPATGLNARLLDYLRTTRFVAQEASRLGASALVIAGDFTERRHPAPWLVAKIRDALGEGPSAQIYLRGNHDGEIAERSVVSILDDGYEEVLEDTSRVGVSRPQLVRVQHDAVIAAIPYLDRHWLRAQDGFAGVPDAELYQVLADQFLAIARGLYAEAREDYPDAGVVLVCHQTLAGAAMSDTQRAFLGDVSLVVDSGALSDIGFEAVVAGHLHRHQVVVLGDRPVLYAGSIERVDFGEAGEAKGFIVADVEPGRFDWEFVPTPARPYYTLDLAGETPELGAARDAIVRVVNVPPEIDPVELRYALEGSGAFEVTEIRRRPVESTVPVGGMSEALAPAAALEEYFAADPDREVLVGRGRELLEAVA